MYSEAETEPWGHHAQFPKAPPRSSLTRQLWETSHSFLINIHPCPSVSVALAVQASLTRLPGLAILKAQLILAAHQHSFIFCVPKQVTNTPDCRIDFWSIRCWRRMPAHCLRTPRAQRSRTSTAAFFSRPLPGSSTGPLCSFVSGVFRTQLSMRISCWTEAKATWMPLETTRFSYAREFVFQHKYASPMRP